ncbi:MAG: hypothetical protein QXS81_03800, partial [Candidatus Micrarchaeaceae archaeon]
AKGEVLLFGTESTSRSKEAWDTFVSSLRKTSSGFREEAANLAESSKDVVAFVEADPFQIARLAKALGSKSEFVDDIIKWGESGDWRIGKEENIAIDALIAGTIIDEEGHLSSKRNADAAYLMLKWMLGDRDAERTLQSKVERLSEIINGWEVEKTMYNKVVDLSSAYLLNVADLDEYAQSAANFVKIDLKELGMENTDLEKEEFSKISSDLQGLQKENDQKLLNLQKVQTDLDEARAQLAKSGTEAGATGYSLVGSLWKNLSGKASKEMKEKEEGKKAVKKLNEEQSKVSAEIRGLNRKKVVLEETLTYLEALDSIKSWEKMIRAAAPEGKINIFEGSKGYSIARSLVSDEEAVNRLVKAVTTILPAIQFQSPHLSGQIVSSPDELVAVHVTQFLPAEGLNGKMVIPSLFDATLSEVPRMGIVTSRFTQRFEKDISKAKFVVDRNTIHFAINDTVKPSGPFTGDWDKMLVAVVAPLNDLIKLNGKPVSVQFGDTFFRTSPGEGLKLPDSTTIVRPPLTDSEKQAMTGEKSFMSQGSTVIYAPEKISLEAVVDYVIKSKGYTKIPFGSNIYNYPKMTQLSNFLIGVVLGVTEQTDASLLNQDVITQFSKGPLYKLSSGEITMATFEGERDLMLKQIFDIANNPRDGRGFPSWYEFRTLYLSGIL